MVSSDFSGSLDTRGAEFSGPVTIQSTNVGRNILLANAHFGKIDLMLVQIGRFVDLRGSKTDALRFIGCSVAGELHLASRQEQPKWAADAKLTLRNTTVGLVRDEPEAWPKHLNLDGFTYASFGRGSIDKRTDVALRGTRWFSEGLAKDEPYAPQPYRQCAKVLREMGHPDMANDVLYAGRERERKNALRNGNNPRATGLALLKWFIGYGYGRRLLWRPLAWVAGLVALGTVVLHVTGVPAELTGSQAAAAAYSFDTLLPIIELEKAHADIGLKGFARYYFYFQKIMGYVLASFLIAGLAGLTK